MYDLNNKKYYNRIIFFIIFGILVGSIGYFLLLLFGNYEYAYTPSEVELSALSFVKNNEVFWYLLRKRVCMLILFLCLSFILSYRFAIYLYGFGFGIFYGYSVSSWFLHDGIHGFIKIMIAFFPHYIFYFVSILFVGSLMRDRNTYSVLKNNSNKVNILKYFLKIIVIFLLLIIGVFFEGYLKKYF